MEIKVSGEEWGVTMEVMLIPSSENKVGGLTCVPQWCLKDADAHLPELTSVYNSRWYQ